MAMGNAWQSALHVLAKAFIDNNKKLPVDMTVNTTASFDDRRKRLVKTVLTFKNKTAGRTWDVPHVGKAYLGPTFLAPNHANWIEFNQAGYNPIPSSDGAIVSTNTAGVGAYAQQLFSFDILAAITKELGGQAGWDVATLKTKVKSLTVTWVGYGEGANADAKAYGATGKLWWAGTTWTTFAGNANTTSASSNIVYGAYSDSIIPNAIDAEGKLHLLVHATYPADDAPAISSVIYTDYIQVEVVYEGLVLNAVMAGVQADGQTARPLLVDPTGAVTPAMRNNVVSKVRMDYKTPVAKTSQRIYDTPHKAFTQRGATFPAPGAAATAGPFELATAEYAKITSQDSTSSSYGSGQTNGEYGQHLFSFNLLEIARRSIAGASGWGVAELRDNAKYFSASWVGYGTRPGGNGAAQKLWTPSTTTWYALGSNTSTSPTTVSGVWTASTVSYIDDAGFVHLLATTDVASDGVAYSIIYTDYVYLDVEIAGQAQQVVLMGVDADGKTYRPVQVDTGGRLVSTGKGVQTALVGASTAVAVGSSYQSALQTVEFGSRLAVLSRMSSSCKHTVLVQWKSAAGTLIATELVIDRTTSGIDSYVSTTMKSPFFTVVVTNGDTSEVTLAQLHYTVFAS
jgi:hypothetical protein